MSSITTVLLYCDACDGEVNAVVEYIPGDPPSWDDPGSNDEWVVDLPEECEGCGGGFPANVVLALEDEAIELAKHELWIEAPHRPGKRNYNPDTVEPSDEEDDHG